MNNFFRRTLTGAWIVIFVLGGFWLHPVSFILTGLILLAGTQYEYYLLVRNWGVRPRIGWGVATGISVYALSVLIAAGKVQSSWYLSLVPLVIVIMILELYSGEEKPFDTLAHTFFPILYTAFPFSLFPYSAFSHAGLPALLPHGEVIFSPGIVVGFFMLIWANDTGAYLAGISFGKHRLFEKVSPKKTWEGFIGGIVMAALAAGLLSGWLGVVSRTGWLLIAVTVSVAGTYGDLIESMLKRSADVKDSGSILPGHGGFLDRFDSTIISFPLVYLFITLFG